jgi:hypothetical protein
MAPDRSCFRAPNRYSPAALTAPLVRTWSMIPKIGTRLSERIMRNQENWDRHPGTLNWIKV